MLEYLQQNARCDVPFGKAEASLVHQGWLFKTYLVADTHTLIALNSANTAVASAALDISKHRLAVQEVQDDIATATELARALERQQEDVRSRSRALSLGNSTELSAREIDSLSQQLDNLWAEHRVAMSRLDGLTNEHAKRVQSLVQHGAEIAGNVQAIIHEALLAARSELEISVDRQKLDASRAANDAILRGKVAELMKHIQEVATPSSGDPPSP